MELTVEDFIDDGDDDIALQREILDPEADTNSDGDCVRYTILLERK